MFYNNYDWVECFWICSWYGIYITPWVLSTEYILFCENNAHCFAIASQVRHNFQSLSHLILTTSPTIKLQEM